MTGFSIADRPVGPGSPCFVVGEVAQAHDGVLDTAHAYIDAVAEAGADAVKFQTHIADAESTPHEPWRVRFNRKDKSRYDYWKRMEFSEEEWVELRDHAGKRGLVFLSSPFSIEAVYLLERLNVPAWKFGAGEITTLPLIEAAAHTGKPVLLSSGMARDAELDAAVEAVRARGAPVAVYQCTTAYPCPPEQTGLNQLARFRERYGCPVGLSDHSGAIYAGLAAAALGADLLEVHVTRSRDTGLPDEPASLLPDELRQLCDGVAFIHAALGNPVDKNVLADTPAFAELRRTFSKSVVAARDLSAGHRLEAGDLALKKPGTGLPPSMLEKISGRTLKRAVAKDTLLAEDDFNDE